MNLLDLSKVKENSFEIHPKGEFTATCIKAELKTTKSGSGKYIECEFTTNEGKVWSNFNVINESEKAQEIGRGQLKQFLKFAGADSSQFNLDKVTDLEGLKANIVVKHETDSYGEKAKISYFKAVKEVAAPLTQTSIPF